MYGKKIIGIFASVFVISLFTACRTPLTKNVINDIGIDDIDRFQYYISEELVLTATEKIREPNIDKRGTATIKESSFRDIIIIGNNTKGILMSKREDENGLLILEICFEEKASDSDKTITFRQDGPGLEHNFYIVYADQRRRIVQYGDREYTAETRTGERALLKIRVKKSEIEKERIRRVKGRKVEN